MIARMSFARLLIPLLLLPGCLIDVGDDQGDAGSDDALAMEEGNGATDSPAGECFDPPHCNPLAPNCADSEICAANGSAFDCVPVPEEGAPAGAGEACTTGAGLSCEAGLVCVPLDVPGCTGGTGCCLALCDIEQAQCPMAMVCSAYFESGGSQCHDDLGVCVPE
jgi:hypothetical protein